MNIDPRLAEVDDSLYRVALRALIINRGRVLLVKEFDGGGWWAIPGGGVDYGETAKACLVREIEEELGVTPEFVKCDFKIAHYDIGKVVNGVPRMNIYFKATVPEKEIEPTPHVKEWAWFSKKEFLDLNLNPSYDKTEISTIAFS